MREVNYQAAVQALQTHLSGRWDGRESDGRDEMVRVLTQQLGYDHGEANSAIDAMICAGQLRYQTLREHADTTGSSDTTSPGIVAAGPQTTGSAGLPGAPTAPGADFAPGFWEIGGDGDDIGGRKGQVTPT